MIHETWEGKCTLLKEIVADKEMERATNLLTAPSPDFGSDPAPLEAFDQSLFRSVVGHFASGVSVITTAVDGELFGTTASAVSSLSMDPPMMLMCLNRSSSTHEAVGRAGVFAINILAERQGDLAMHFGKRGPDKFTGVGYSLSQHHGVPLLDEALATIVCRVVDEPTGGTHTVFFGHVIDAQAQASEPIVYYRGKFGRFQQANEEDAYQAVRRWVLDRRTPLGSDLVPERIAAELRLQPDDVYAALIRLTHDQLVDRDIQGVLTPHPMTADFIDTVYDARATIEIGVIAASITNLQDDDIAELENITERLGRLRNEGTTAEALSEFLRLNAAYHDKVVATAGSRQLVESYSRLGIGTVWNQALTPNDWGPLLDHSHIAALTAALRNGDSAAAITALQAHTKFAKQRARETIERHGGQV